MQGNEWVLEDLGSTNGTYVNGYRLTPGIAVYVSPTDEVTLGARVKLPWPSPDGTERPGSGDRLAQPAPSDAQVMNIGRDPDNDIYLDYPMISRHHARIMREASQWIIEDRGSVNGTALNRIDNRIQRAVLAPSDEIYFGSYKIAASRILKEKRLTQGEGQFERVKFQGDRMVLGRDPECDQPLDYPMISWRHAVLEKTSQGIYVEDLNSRNGTYVNGVRVSGKTLVKTGDEIGLGSFRFMLLEDGALAKREYIGNVTIEVAGVVVNAPNGTRLLDAVSLSVFPSELVALMGPAGAGKTTFLKAVNGYTAPASGRVLFNGNDLYHYYDLFRQQMSYVPQDDIVHPQLTVREALYYTAKLRTDLTDAEIDQRIKQVLASLEIQDKENTIIGSPEKKVLSGGQRKRVNIAMELIAKAPVIFLDEPTSGLSSYDAENVVRVLKKLSSEGTTIVTTIHQPSLNIFQQFDNLIMISRDKGGCGALAYFGPAYPDSIEFFDPAGTQEARKQPGRELNPEMLLTGLAKKKTSEWASQYEQSRYRKQFVTERMGKIPSRTDQVSKSTGRGFGFGQWWTLLRRNMILKARDRAQSIILLIQAPLFALLLGLVFGSLQYTGARPTPGDMLNLAKHAVGIEFLMVVAAIWFGCNNVARDIVGEWTVFQRERMVTLKLPSYLFSKLAVAAVLCLFQCATLLGIVTLFCKLQGNFLATLAILFLASMVGAAIGLCVSARTSTTEAAIAMLPLILLPMIALAGGLTPIHSMSKPMQAITLAVPSRWAYEAALVQEAKSYHGKDTSAQKNDGPCDLAENYFPDRQAQACGAGDRDKTYKRTDLRVSFGILGGMFVLWTLVALVFLRMRDIQ
jgi:ABC-type multidrug transport system ATPase subunit/pSer/pThr/pTyr-binding forkhead associated (FHA) protein